MAEIRWTLIAAEDVRLLEDWIARDSPLNAVDFTDRLVKSVEKLGTAPLLGRVVPEFRDERIREIIFRRYRIVYSHISDRVSILRVVHGARDLAALLSREPWCLE